MSELNKSTLPKREETAAAETLRICKILSINGLDFGTLTLTYIDVVDGKRKYILLKDLKGMEDVIKQNGLNPEFPLGQRIKDLRRAYQGRRYGMTDDERAEAKGIKGLVPSKKRETTAVAEILRICEILHNNGFNFNQKLIYEIDGKTKSTLLEDLVEKDVIKQNKLDPKFPLGYRIKYLQQAYTGKWPMTENEKGRAEEIPGLLKETAAAETLRICKILSINGLNFRTLTLTYIDVVDGKRKDISLKDLKGMEGVIKQNGLNPEFPLGQKITNLRRAYKGRGRYAITDGERQKARKIKGLVPYEKKETAAAEAVAETLRICEILAINGLNFRTLKLIRVVDGKTTFILLKDLKGMEDVITQNKLDPEFPLGKRIKALKRYYNKHHSGPKFKTKHLSGLRKQAGIRPTNSGLGQPAGMRPTNSGLGRSTERNPIEPGLGHEYGVDKLKDSPKSGYTGYGR